MRPEKLQSLLYSFIENRSFDDTDSAGNLAVESDDPLSRHHLEDQYIHGGGLPPVSPLQFFPFAPLNAHSPSVVETGRRLGQLAAEYSSAHPDKSILKFEEICMIKEPIEQIISIPVIRSQNCADKVTKVTWKTCDKTASSGIHYVGSSGEIVFNECETKRIIEIKILDSSDEANDLRFAVELFHVDGLFNPTPLTITLKKINQFYDDERQVINNLPRSLPFSIDDIRCALSDCLTSRTFHIALAHLCSTRSTVDVQFALAFELSLTCLRNLPGESIFNILVDYFRMDDIDF